MYQNGRKIATHADIKDEGQTVRFPKVRTTLVDKDTNSHVGRASNKMTLVDTVRYENLVAGKEYKVTGTLFDKETGRAILDANGSQITAETTFKVEKASGSVDVTFTFDSSSLAGKSVVAFEDVYNNGRKVATHADINDTDQTVVIPKIGTTLTDTKTKGHRVLAEKEVKLTDTIHYSNLTAGKEYTVEGKLIVKETGKALLDKNKKEITAKATFKAEKSEGDTRVTFTFDGSLLAGQSVVAFEDLYQGKLHVASHADINDEGQTVHFPKIGTTLLNKESGKQELDPSEKVTLEDTVQYKGLEVGKEYTLKGELYSKKTGKALGVKAETTFKAEKADGVATVTFTFNASKLAGESVVAFEHLYQDKDEIASHTDINDAAQTVTFRNPKETPKETPNRSNKFFNQPNTGVGGMNYKVWIGAAIGLVLLAGGGYYLYKKQDSK